MNVIDISNIDISILNGDIAGKQLAKFLNLILLVICCWLFVVGYLLLIICCWLFVVGYLLLGRDYACCWLFVVGCLLLDAIAASPKIPPQIPFKGGQPPTN